MDWKSTLSSLEEIVEIISKHDLVYKRSKKRPTFYYNIPVAFDIETSSFENEGRKQGIMYVWMLSAAGKTITGRTWDEFFAALDFMAEKLELQPEKRLIIYVHNLSFEFQFICSHMRWTTVFASKAREPIYAVTETGIEFRCSYKLTGLSLAKSAENLIKYKCEKAVGDLDYSLVRSGLTPLTETEWGYCIADVLVLNAIIQEKIEADGDISKIPLTNTGYVREYCRQHCLYDGDHKYINKQYSSLMNQLTLTLDEYIELEEAFAGGFTHANANYVDVTLRDITSKDFISSYPAVMCYEMFPMSRGIRVDDETANKYFDQYISEYCCMFRARFTCISTMQYEQIISSSKCRDMKSGYYLVNNGRLVTADTIEITMTEVDYESFRAFYVWDKMEVKDLYVYKKGYLPTEFVKCILHFYERKTELKGKEGKEEEYMKNKGMLNSSYGMSVQKPLRDEIEFDSDLLEWIAKVVTPEEDSEEDEEDSEEDEELTPEEIQKGVKEHQISRYNTNKNRFLFFPWGVWITAYARRNLFRAVLELGEDYVYSDTDSVKFLHAERHDKYFSSVNTEVEKKLRKAMEHHGLDFELCRPRNKLMGAWDPDGFYTRFKTLGAKRYLVESKGKLKLTMAGCNPETGAEYLQLQKDPFEAFTTDVVIPKEYSGRLIHTYDKDAEGDFVDYLGQSFHYEEKTFVHLEASDYTVNRSDEFRAFLNGGYLQDKN